MTDMVDRVSEVIFNMVPLTQRECRTIARAVIAAMREPTKAMLQGSISHQNFFGEEGLEAWQECIDAALKEQP